MRARRGISARYIKAINFVKKRFASPFFRSRMRHGGVTASITKTTHRGGAESAEQMILPRKMFPTLRTLCLCGEISIDVFCGWSENENSKPETRNRVSGGKGVQIVKIESLREVKANLSKIVKDLPAERSVVITKNGRPCAVLFPVTKIPTSKACCWRNARISGSLSTGPTTRAKRKASPSSKIYLANNRKPPKKSGVGFRLVANRVLPADRQTL